MAPLKIARVHHEEDDVFAAEETKLHTLSRQAISEMLETAEKQEANSSAPPPASGVRGAEGRPAVTKSGMIAKVPAPARLPVIDDVPVLSADDEDDEPTRLSERMSIPRPQLVTQLMKEPPVIIGSAAASVSMPVATVTPAQIAITEIEVVVPGNHAYKASVPSASPAALDARVDRGALAIAIAAFLCTLLPGLVLLHHLLTR